MADVKIFAESTRLFNESRFLEGLEEIDKSIDQQPYSSILYSNRALFLVEIGHVRQAIKDLKYSIELDYLNYLSYFNLFSIHVREGHLQLAVQELHCALSAIYLIAAKETKSHEYVAKSVHYSKNNIEARVLKGLMDLEHGRFREAHQQLVWACGIETDSIMLAKVRNLIKKIGDSTQRNDEEESSSNSQKRETRRLQSAFKKYRFPDIEAEIRDKVIEFNQIYNIVSQRADLITEKIGERGNRKEVFMRQKSTTSSQQSNTAKTDPEKEAIQQDEIPEEKPMEASSHQVIDNLVDALFWSVLKNHEQPALEALKSIPVKNQNQQELSLMQVIQEYESVQYSEQI